MGKGVWLTLTALSVLILSTAAFWFGSGYRASNGLSDGINVHGAWEVTVSDRDGSNSVVYNFENEIYAQGAKTLAHVLMPYQDSTSEKIAQWTVTFMRAGSGNANRLCSSPAKASLLEGRSGTAVGISLKASCSVDGDRFTKVEELMRVYTYSVNIPNAGPDSVGREFTSKWLDSPISVSPDQVIEASVDITFD